MSYYKVKYKIDDYDTPHYRFYNAVNSETATAMFNETAETSLAGNEVEVLDVVAVQEKDSDVCECSCDCNTDTSRDQ